MLSNQLAGSGDVRTEVRTVGDFTRVEARNGIQLEVTIGTPVRVEVSAQENLLPITSTTVANGRLTVETTQSYVGSRAIVVRITMPALDELSVSGGVAANASGLAASALLIDASGGAVITANGSADTLTLNASGGAVLNMGSLSARTATVSLSGGVTGAILVTESVSGSASGGVIVAIQGHPASVNVSTSGGAIVTTP
jgi:hypothetical protein